VVQQLRVTAIRWGGGLRATLFSWSVLTPATLGRPPPSLKEPRGFFHQAYESLRAGICVAQRGNPWLLACNLFLQVGRNSHGEIGPGRASESKCQFRICGCQIPPPKQASTF